MIHAVTYDLRPQYEGLLDEMYRARHRLYVEGRKWRELAKADGREIDQFDTESTLYFLAVGEDGALQGGIRLVPSTVPHMLNSVFPELCSRIDLPNNSTTWELSRVFVSHNDRFDENGLLLKGKLMCGMMEFALQNGITDIISVSDSYFLPRLLEIGLNVMPLGLPKAYETGEMLALKFTVDAEAVHKAQEFYKIPPNILWQEPVKPEFLAEPSAQETFMLETAFNHVGSEYAEEFAAIMPKLSSRNAGEVAEGERQLEDLARRVRSGLMASHGIRKSQGVLN